MSDLVLTVVPMPPLRKGFARRRLLTSRRLWEIGCSAAEVCRRYGNTCHELRARGSLTTPPSCCSAAIHLPLHRGGKDGGTGVLAPTGKTKSSPFGLLSHGRRGHLRPKSRRKRRLASEMAPAGAHLTPPGFSPPCGKTKSSPFGLLFVLVTRRGLEPRTFALKGRCSTN